MVSAVCSKHFSFDWFSVWRAWCLLLTGLSLIPYAFSSACLTASPFSGTMTHAHLLLLGLTILCELLFQDLITLAKNALAKFYPNRASIVYQIYGIVQVWCNCVVPYPSTLSDKHPSNCWFSSVYDDDDFFFSTASPDNGSAVGENAEHVIKVVRS